MITIHKSICIVLCASAMSGAAYAEEMNSETCAQTLTPTGKSIYEAVAPSVEADSDIKKLLKKKVRPLVMSGKLKRKEAKANAPLAGKCLFLLKQEKAADPRI